VALISHCANIDLINRKEKMEYFLIAMIIAIVVVRLWGDKK